jgi:hypothetical protein
VHAEAGSRVVAAKSLTSRQAALERHHLGPAEVQEGTSGPHPDRQDDSSPVCRPDATEGSPEIWKAGILAVRMEREPGGS